METSKNEEFNLQIFESEQFGCIRTTMIGEEPWFVGKDVALVLGYGNARDALSKHVDDEDKKILLKSENATLEIPNRGLIIINESGLYSLIMQSKLPSAKGFKRWVTSEVLPALRKTGQYHLVKTGEDYKPTRPITTDDYMVAARVVSRCINTRLPMVLDLYRRAGLDIPKVEEESQVMIEERRKEWEDEELNELLRRFTLTEMAERLGCSPGTLCRYQQGQRHPRPERRKKIIAELTIMAEEQDAAEAAKLAEEKEHEEL